MEIVKSLIVSLFSSALSVAIFSFILKKYFSSIIDFSEYRKKKIFDHQFELSMKYDDEYIDKSMSIFPELIAMAYQIKQLVDDSLREDLACKWKSNLRPLVAVFSDSIIKYRAIFNKNVFESSHDFKRACQDLLMYQDILTREEFQFDYEYYIEKIPIIKEKANKIYKTFDVLEETVRKEIENNRNMTCMKKK